MYGLATIRAMNTKAHDEATTIWKSRNTGRYYYEPTDSWFDTLQEAEAIERVRFTTLLYLGASDKVRKVL
jgi:hypothetical protein